MPSDPPNVATEPSALPSLALREADTHRSVRAYFVAGLVALLGVVGLLLLGGPPLLRWPLLAAAASTALFCLWLAWSRRHQGVFSDAEASTVGILMSISVVLAMAYVGPMTAPAVMLVGLVVGLAMGDPRRARRCAAIIMVGYAVVGALAVAGIIPPAMDAAVGGGAVGHVFVITLVEAVLAASFFFGVIARRATVAALAHVESARVALAGREALLHEAFDDLRRLAAGHGRLSGAQLGSFRLEALIGRGGMGEVYRGKDLVRGVAVAVKVLHPNLAAEPSLVTRFFREADVSSALESPHIVKVLEHGVGSDGAPFLVMDLVEGRSLSAILLDERRLSLAAATVLCRDVAAALAVAHEAGIVHRDVKLGNVMLCDDGRWMLLDFGISRLHESSGTLTHGAPIGTPGFMPPEQIDGRPVDARADVFSLGVVLYRVLTGRPPFRGKDLVATAFNTVHRQPPQPRTLADMPADVELVLALALAKKPSERLASAADLSDAFERAVVSQLDEALRDRAHGLLRRMPWSEDISEAPAVAGRRVGPEGDTVVEDDPTRERRTS